MKIRPPLYYLYLAALSLGTGPLLAQTVTWDNDADGTASDGSGTWLSANQWLDGITPYTWTNSGGENAIIGSNGNGGNIDLTGGVTVNDATFDNYTGKYQLSNGTLTVNGTLTWGPNNTPSGSTDGVEFLNTSLLAGTGTIIANGNYPVTKSNGQFNIRTADVSGFSGTYNVQNGVLFTEGTSVPSASSNVILNGIAGASNGAIYSSRWSQTLTRDLGTGAGQIQVIGNRSGFEGQGTNGLTVRLTDTGIGPQQVQWGSADFNPSALVLQSPNSNDNGQMTFDTEVDLNGADRTIEVDIDHGVVWDATSNTENNVGRARARMARPIINTSGTVAGLIKEGPGRLSLGATNTYDGGTTHNEGILHYERAAAMPDSGTHTFNDGTVLWIDIGGGDDFTIGAGTAAGSLGGLLSGTGPGTSTTVFNGGNHVITLLGNGTVESDIPDLGTGGTILWLWNGNKTLSGNNTFTGTMRVGKRGGTARTVTLGSATALSGGADVIIDTNATSTLDLNGNNATIGLLTLGSNNGGQGGTVDDTLGGGVLTMTGGIFVDSHNDGGGRVLCDTLDLNGLTQTFFHNGNNRANSDLIIDADIQNGGLITNATAGQTEIYLNGANTYAGGTTHQAGRLVINGSLADSTMSITGGDVQGSGTLTFGPTDQVLTSGGTIDLSGFTVEGSSLTDPVYIIVDSTGGGSYSGTFAVENVPGYTVNYDYDGFGTQVALEAAAGSPFDTWVAGASGPSGFGDDSNGDGITNGLAFLLGAAGPDVNANDKLPTATDDSGNLVLTFSMLNAANRGTASLATQHSADLGITDAWDAVGNEETVPETSGMSGVVDFDITPNGTLNDVIATIPGSEGAGGKLFGRVEGTQ